MKRILIFMAFLACPLLGWSQSAESQMLLSELNEKRWYFMGLNGQFDFNENGHLLMNGIAIDLSATEIAYKETEDAQDAYLLLFSEKGKEIYEFREKGQVLFKTNNLLHPIKSKEQAAELVVLFTMLKAMAGSAS